MEVIDCTDSTAMPTYHNRTMGIGNCLVSAELPASIRDNCIWYTADANMFGVNKQIVAAHHGEIRNIGSEVLIFFSEVLIFFHVRAKWGLDRELVMGAAQGRHVCPDFACAQLGCGVDGTGVAVSAVI